MKRKVFTGMVSLILTVSMLVSLTGCGGKVQASNLMKGIAAGNVNVDLGAEETDTGNRSVMDFSVRLFQSSRADGNNTLVSPLSVLCALAMTANGAKGDTQSQMENVLGMPTAELNNFIYHYLENVPQGEAYKLNLANSIWFTEKEQFTVNQDFLQINADYYGADIYQAPFDKSTLKDINTWIKDKTDGMIPEILDEIPDDAVMYLVNALAFEAEWADVYDTNQVQKGLFTLENGEIQEAEYMNSKENWYLEDEKATGVLKYYKDGNYAFVALLPKEGVSVSDYADFLTGEHLSRLLSDSQTATVITSIPKFETEYSIEMSDVLSEMGMPDAFVPSAADFSGIGSSTEGNLFINRVLHKTFISVGEIGTRAGASTVVEVETESAMEQTEVKTVELNRPFIYMLIDCENNIPFFMGTMMSVGGK